MTQQLGLGTILAEKKRDRASRKAYTVTVLEAVLSMGDLLTVDKCPVRGVEVA